MNDIEYQVIDDLNEVWFIADTLNEAKKRMREIASEPENEWLEFHIEKVEYK